jgi:hypothetical protein
VVGIESGHSNVENPTIFPIVPPEPILYPELLSPIKSLSIGFQAPLLVFGVNSLRPPMSEFG